MINASPFAERVRQAFTPTPRGVVGLVDDLLALCQTYQLRILFEDGRCNVRRLGDDMKDSLVLPVPKSVFRAALARIAALCNEQHPHSVTPYRGEGEITVPSAGLESSLPPSICHVAYTNTPSEQRLEIRFARSSAVGGTRFTVLLRAGGRAIRVFGHALTYIPHTSASESGSYGILSRVGEDENLIALFPVTEVIGVFSDDLGDSAENLQQAETLSSP